MKQLRDTMKKLEQKPIPLDKGQAESKREFGDLYFENGNLLGAEDLYTISIKHNPKDVITYCHRATVRALQNKMERAKEDAFKCGELLRSQKNPYKNSMTDTFLERALSLVWNRKCEMAMVSLTIGRVVFPCNPSLP